jgi:flavin-dependent dehydrogenase
MVGDAAVAMDPLSGQGSFAALTCGIRAANAFAEYRRGGIQALQDYAQEQQRRLSQILMAQASYYRMERRWTDSPFWQRRHKPGLG